MLILIATAVRFPYARQADKVTNQDFIKILEDGQAADVSIHQNPPVSYTHLDVYKRQALWEPRSPWSSMKPVPWP